MYFPTARIETDVTNLMMSDFKVELDEDHPCQVVVGFYGPKDSPYEGGQWKILITLVDGYPYNPPSIGFINTIFHPNVEECSGLICFDIIKDTWSPNYDLLDILEIFLPQLLLYPNPLYPINKDAAEIMSKDRPAFKTKVKEFIEMFAKPKAVAAETEEKSSEGSEEDNSSNAKAESRGGESKDEAAAAKADSSE